MGQRAFPNHEAFILSEAEGETVRSIREHGALSRTDLSNLTGLSRAKISSTIEGLIRSGILEEVGLGDSQGGRRPRLVHFNSSAGFVAGIDMGASGVDIALADLTGQIVARHFDPTTNVATGPVSVLSRVQEIIAGLLSEQQIAPEQLRGIGMGVPGPVEFSTGLLTSPPIMPGWDRFPIRDFLGRKFPNTKVIIDNDVNVMALGELRAGEGIGSDNFIYVKIGTGIGAGIVCDGEVYRGSTGCAGDVGHICIDYNGPVCHCGNIGCLEVMAAGPAIARRAIQAAERNESPILARLMREKSGLLSAEDVGIAAATGDHVSISIIQDSGRMVGRMLASVINFFNPSLILIGGGVSKIGYHLLSSIRQEVLYRSLPLSTRQLQIKLSSMSDDAGVIGAVHLILERIFVVQN